MATATLLAAFMAASPLQSGSAGASSAAQSASVPVEIGHQLHVAARISELPVPPTVPANGMRTNPTGCVSGDWGALGSPGFYWDSHYVLLGVTYAGAPTTGPASIYQGPQVVLEKTEGTRFSDGDAWKCITCGVTLPSGIVQADFTYPPPHALPGDKQILVGNGILDCTSSTGVLLALTDPACQASNTRIYPIYWGSNPLGGPGGVFGNGREWRLSPDGVHLEWDSIFFTSTGLGEDEFEGALAWDPTNQQYDATVVLADNGTDTALQQIQVTYHNYVQSQGLNVVNGTEEVDTTTIPGDITWNDNLTVIGLQGAGSQVTSPGGFSVNINDLNFANNFRAVGTMTTTLNGQTYTQPANGS